MLFFHKLDDNWSEGIDNLIKELNLPCDNSISVSVSHDGKFLFFMSARIPENKLIENKFSFKLFEELNKTHQNGNSDIYWINTSFIEKLKKKAEL